MGTFLFYEIQHGWASNQVFFKDLRKKDLPWTEIAPGTTAHYAVSAYKDQFIIESDDGAPHGRVFAADPAHLDRASWKEIIPEPKDESIRSVNVRAGKLAVTYLKNAYGRLEIQGDRRQARTR